MIHSIWAGVYNGDGFKHLDTGLGISTMLICPECKFENPDKNKFCQNCGTSLTERACPVCGADVPNNVEQCQHCGNSSGTIWWGIIKFHEETFTQESDMSDEAPVEESTFIQVDVPTPVLELEEEAAISFDVGSYLDTQQRYKIIEVCKQPNESSGQEMLVRVFDCKPYQITPVAAQLEQGLSSSIEAPGILDVAKPYLALHKLCNYGIPPIHDAWVIENNKSVVLLEDRSNYPYLLELWQEDETSSLRVVYYFHRMTQLWQMLEPFGCCQSLLDLGNLRLDEDQELVLQRLYQESKAGASVDFEAFEPASTDLSIKALATIWHTLFKQVGS